MQQARAEGVLLGLAVGDAFGAPLEGCPPPAVPAREMPASCACTDDTLQALAVARSLVVCRGFSPEDCMARLLEGFRTCPRFYGPTSTAVFTLVLSGELGRLRDIQVNAKTRIKRQMTTTLEDTQRVSSSGAA